MPMNVSSVSLSLIHIVSVFSNGGFSGTREQRKASAHVYDLKMTGIGGLILRSLNT